MIDKLTRPQAIQAARQMWDGGTGGWTIAEIQRYLAERGVQAARTSVRGWVDPEWWRYRQQYEALRRSRVRQTQQACLPNNVTPDLLLALRLDDHLSYAAIAAVARRFLGEDLSPEAWRYRLEKLGAPKNEVKAANARAQARRRQMRVVA